MNIIFILKSIASRLNIDENTLLDAVKGKINNKELNNEITDPDRLMKINELLDVDSKLVEFERNNILQEQTKENFNKLKQTLGKLQILVLIKKLSESKGCDDVINSLLSVLNTKFESVNNILTLNLIQTGGTGNKYYKKYIKYKIKYLTYKNM
jgi:trehalose-6-phosphate synthase